MKAYGRNLEWISRHQYGDDYHTGMAMPSSGKHRGGTQKKIPPPV